MLLISVVLLGAEILPPRAAAADSGFAYKTISLQSHGAEIPFRKAPSETAAQAAYPLSARKTTSVVALNCSVANEGVLKDCKINRSDPDDKKLRAAALKLSRQFAVISTYQYSNIMLFLQFSGTVARCVEPFCFQDLIQAPPPPVQDQSSPPR